MTYMVSARQWLMMVALLKEAAKDDRLSADQIAACSHDPMDVPIDMETLGQYVTHVFVMIDDARVPSEAK